MEALDLARWQFGLTTVVHFLFVPLSMGLSVLLAVMYSIYYRTGDAAYKRLSQFFGKLFVINFALGTATGIVQEFQFGMNWSEYSRFVGDVFGVPLAIEALAAFFLESTFLGLWIFGWNRIPRALHLASIWLVALGAHLSALWILVANAFMQMPVGYTIENGRARMTDFLALVLSEQVQTQVPHVLIAGLIVGGFFVLGISAWHLLRRSHVELFGKSLKLALIVTTVASLAAATSGHQQAQHVAKNQPMKLAAMEGLWETEQPAAFSLFGIIDQAGRQTLREVKLPHMLSVLAANNTTAEVKGLNDLQREYEAKYGPGDYTPPVAITYWAFRVKVGLGMAFIALSLWGLWLWWRGRLEVSPLFLRLGLLFVFLPFVATSAGWIVAEMGRQPWVVYGLLETAAAVSLSVTPTYLWITLIGFGLLYAALVALEAYLFSRHIREVPAPEAKPHAQPRPALPQAEPVY
ncbi:cytochrome d ubiquinol oxidase subunit I [Deinobacterium chartae]|uniref:Cytochrome d ubiquinol oxidase subunit I n=1 Tax=Deinobacterium chartae TaxID=521158 RepID=A0A841I3I2_9DEIO|nr:cytochrome ubiquinol oxidase subunit I [Deinobacterium chartae]MBB6098475.1 cytochrome d ubiquinol oxidase subunit I [Deinobacterium chartae]